jgi:hypothetical protein
MHYICKTVNSKYILTIDGLCRKPIDDSYSYDCAKCQTILSSGRAPHINKTAAVQQQLKSDHNGRTDSPTIGRNVILIK